MLQSMTGYGKAQKSFRNKQIAVEIKSLNSKQCDINMKLPYKIREKEMDLRKMMVDSLQRGKVTCVVNYEITDEEKAGTINAPVVKNYIRQIKRFSEDMKISFDSELLSTALTMPEAFEKEEEELDQEEWEFIQKCMQEALNKCLEFRRQEGAAIEKDFKSRINVLIDLLNSVDSFENRRIEAIKERLNERLNEIKNDMEIDRGRFEQEVVYYLEKMDITEEKVRLKNHMDYFLKMLENNESGGKKLNFIIQEMVREINTIGSKANDSDIQKIVVQMKDEVEKIREQVMNVL
ncbi:MAG: YicC family protein [Bacteroidales bacterium]|nr:YicC family protein [Bacteroidales bacterium]